MLEGKGVIEDTDMPVKMQIQAMRWASQALDVYDVLDFRSIAAHIKKGVDFCTFVERMSCSPHMISSNSHCTEFDKKYGGGWQCVVGSKFGCYFTHTKGTFIYFTLERLNFLIFKGATSP